MYSIKLISLNNCPYSISAEKFFKDKKIKIELVKINHNKKNLYKNNKINTFPQIYLISSGKNHSKLLGGFNDIQDINNNVYKIDVDTCMNYLNKKYPKFDRKEKLRIIQIFN